MKCVKIRVFLSEAYYALRTRRLCCNTDSAITLGVQQRVTNIMPCLRCTMSRDTTKTSPTCRRAKNRVPVSALLGLAGPPIVTGQLRAPTHETDVT